MPVNGKTKRFGLSIHEQTTTTVMKSIMDNKNKIQTGQKDICKYFKPKDLSQ